MLLINVKLFDIYQFYYLLVFQFSTKDQYTVLDFFFKVKVGGQTTQLFNIYKRFFYSYFKHATSHTDNIAFDTKPMTDFLSS
jgi:hypothetical protein